MKPATRCHFSNGLKNVLLFTLLFCGVGSKAQWLPVNTGITIPGNAKALASDGTNLYAGLADSINGGIYISSDLGNSWSAVNSGLPDLNVWSLAVSGSKIFACVINHGVYVSTDQGNSWTAINSGLSSLFVRTVMIKDTMIYAATNVGIFQSSIAGSYS